MIRAMSSPSFTCDRCGAAFSMPPAVLAKFPGWAPRTCLACRDEAKAAAAPGTNAKPRPARKANPRPTVTAMQNLSVSEVLERFHDGPQDGVFTDGGAQPNPGRGGWGVVWVRDGEILAERHGVEAATTNNRMELTAMIEALRLVPPDADTTVYSDSELCVRTANEWAASWERAGWKRKAGPIKNLELVKELLALKRARPKVKIQWAPAHSGWRWNEYADALASQAFL
jgi:ribonuclease HI